MTIPSIAQHCRMRYHEFVILSEVRRSRTKSKDPAPLAVAAKSFNIHRKPARNRTPHTRDHETGRFPHPRNVRYYRLPSESNVPR